MMAARGVLLSRSFSRRGARSLVADDDAFRRSVRRFVETEISPHLETWEEARGMPRELWRKAGEIGLLGVGYPEEYGGLGSAGHPLLLLALTEELGRAASGGLLAGLLSHNIALPPLLACGSEELKRRVAPEVLSGEKIMALAVTEPGGGSDVANLQTTARREGDEFVVNGEKTYITSGLIADYYTVAVRTGGPGPKGVSVLLVEKGTHGFTQIKLEKMGWHCSDTAALYFDDARVPVANLVGEENEGFKAIMSNFNNERIWLASIAESCARACLEEATEWAQQRTAFGKKLIEHQVVRHKLVDMATLVNSTRAFLYDTARRYESGEEPVAEICQLKNLATRNMELVVSDAVQILGGMGYMRGTKAERVFRETKVLQIGGGASEIMKDLAAKFMKL